MWNFIPRPCYRYLRTHSSGRDGNSKTLTPSPPTLIQKDSGWMDGLTCAIVGPGASRSWKHVCAKSLQVEAPSSLGWMGKGDGKKRLSAVSSAHRKDNSTPLQAPPHGAFLAYAPHKRGPIVRTYRSRSYTATLTAKIVPQWAGSPGTCVISFVCKILVAAVALTCTCTK